MDKMVLTNDVTVFVLENGSQYKGLESEGKYFNSVVCLLDKLLSINNVDTKKVGFSGTKMDLAAFLADFLYFAEFQNAKFIIQTKNTDDYDPDTPMPENFGA